jgi:hypothetical protein
LCQPAFIKRLNRKGGEIIGYSYSAPERVARSTAQALSQESRQEWHFEHRPPETLVCIEERIAPDSKEESYSPQPTPTEGIRRINGAESHLSCQQSLKRIRGGVNGQGGG